MAQVIESPRRGVIEGNFAASLGQFQRRPDEEAALEIDSRVVLANTTRLIGELGETEVDTHIAATALFVDQGAPDSGEWSSTKGRLARMVYGRKSIGGYEREAIHTALERMYRWEIVADGVSADRGEYVEEFLDYERLLVNLRFDKQIRYRRDAPEKFDAQLTGAKRDGTVRATYARWYVQQIQAGYWRDVDWDKLRSLSGAAKTLWIVLSSPRLPFVDVPDAPQLEELHLPLSVPTYRALGIRASKPAACKRTLTHALSRLSAVDETYVEIEIAENPRGGFRLTVVRRRHADAQLRLALEVPGTSATLTKEAA